MCQFEQYQGQICIWINGSLTRCPQSGDIDKTSPLQLQRKLDIWKYPVCVFVCVFKVTVDFVKVFDRKLRNNTIKHKISPSFQRNITDFTATWMQLKGGPLPIWICIFCQSFWIRIILFRKLYFLVKIEKYIDWY